MRPPRAWRSERLFTSYHQRPIAIGAESTDGAVDRWYGTDKHEHEYADPIPRPSTCRHMDLVDYNEGARHLAAGTDYNADSINRPVDRAACCVRAHWRTRTGWRGR